MVSTVSTSSITPRRRSLAKVFDDVATRHAVTPANPAATGAPVANYATAVFVAIVKTLAATVLTSPPPNTTFTNASRKRHERFSGNEANAAVLFAKLLVPTIKEAFVGEDTLFATLFDLEDVTTSIRSEANTLLFSTLELIYSPTSPATDWLESSAETHPHDGKRVLLGTARMLLDSTGSPFQGTQELLDARFLPNVDTYASASRTSTLLWFQRGERAPWASRSEVTGLFIGALVKKYCVAVVNRLMLHDQRAAVDLNTIQLWTRGCYANNVKFGAANGFSAAKLTETTEKQSAIGDLASIILDLKRHQVKNLTGRMDGTKGFAPRAAKPGLKHRFAAKDLPAGGSWSQTEHKKRVAFHEGGGEFIPVLLRQPHVRLNGGTTLAPGLPEGWEGCELRQAIRHEQHDPGRLRERPLRGAVSGRTTTASGLMHFASWRGQP
ncbi:hypothetical protein CYMTET_18720 [Cymbomonas tetramitiformis]|uniref:Uncharacterized protein n=1 Tax=Cymbomonas tetramitiformis TaxID=36881 RepID=A0AAE0G8V4_9CHLO|nr:hypothetical protein CYMTET_18720 [Cymbomonas tetramitiformis]